MERLTTDIISICKGLYKNCDMTKKEQDNMSMIDSIIDFMSIRCKCDKEYYTINHIFDLVKNVTIDYLKTTNSANCFLNEFFTNLERRENLDFFQGKIKKIEHNYNRENMLNAMISALNFAQVRDEINGK